MLSVRPLRNVDNVRARCKVSTGLELGTLHTRNPKWIMMYLPVLDR